MESRSFTISGTKVEYMECKFSRTTRRNKHVLQIDSQDIPHINQLWYLRSTFNKDGTFEDVMHRINAGWSKWKSAYGILVIMKYHWNRRGNSMRQPLRITYTKNKCDRNENDKINN